MSAIFISFIELVLEGGWNEWSADRIKDLQDRRHQNLNNVRVFEANGPCDVKIVEPEVVIRRFRFGTGAIVLVGNSVVSFDSVQIQDELSVDDAGRSMAGKRLRLSD